MSIHKISIVFLLAFTSLGLQASGDDEAPAKKPKRSFVNFLQDYLDIKYSGKSFSEYIYVSVKKQKLYYIKNKAVVAEYKISTAKNGVGERADTEKTPSGLHVVKEKIGDDIPVNGIFKNRVYTGQTARIQKKAISTNSDDVTSRILWLSGEEPGVNQGGNYDSYNRCIYIHGTPEEGLIGKPVSHGCVRMKNKDVVDLYNQVSTGTYVIILNN